VGTELSGPQTTNSTSYSTEVTESETEIVGNIDFDLLDEGFSEISTFSELSL